MNCFEGENVYPLEHPNATWLKELDPCATKAGVDVDKVNACMVGAEAKTVWTKINTYVDSQDVMGFPSVNLNGGFMGNGYDDCLLKALCGNYTGPVPASCKNIPPSPKGC